MSLPADIPPAVADALGYLQHHLQKLTECQNTLEHVINNTLTGLTAQIHSTDDRPCPRSNSCSAFDTHVSASCQPSFTCSIRPVQTADKAKTPFSP